MSENLIKREGHKQVDLFPVLKCDSTWFYARNPAKGDDTVVSAETTERHSQEAEVREMALF